jgi:hypothetical protein
MSVKTQIRAALNDARKILIIEPQARGGKALFAKNS